MYKSKTTLDLCMFGSNEDRHGSICCIIHTCLENGNTQQSSSCMEVGRLTYLGSKVGICVPVARVHGANFVEF